MKYDSEELKIGKKMEMEHTDDPDMAEQIAKDHLKEFPTYYTHLIEMEDKLKEEKDMEAATPNSQPDQMPTMLNVQHDDVPELKDCAPGEHVSFQVSGVVKGNRAGDQFNTGSIEVELDDIKFLGDETQAEDDLEEAEVKDETSEEDAAKMPVSELRKRLPVKKEN